MTLDAHEVNFDGLVGPTHNYSGLSHGNIASMKHRQALSHPRQAALQGLAKMKFLADLGIKQAVLPPQEHPHIPTLRRLGFKGTDANILARIAREQPTLLASVSSASSMWAANAATISPSPDSADGRVHITPANLITQFHRSIEPPTTAAILRAIFADPSMFAHHPPLPPAAHLSDEGAANHTRLCMGYGRPGIEMFTFGRDAFSPSSRGPRRFPARQTLQASQALARTHLLDPSRPVFLQQSPQAIDAGAFHNDVVAVGNGNVLLYHASAFVNAAKSIREIQQTFRAACHGDLEIIRISDRQLPLRDAVKTYLFNSQLVTLADGSMSLIAPEECRTNKHTRLLLEGLPSRCKSIKRIDFVQVRQSMRNGGGPACLRLRVVLTNQQLAKVKQEVFFSDALYERLKAWITRHYRERLSPRDLADPKLLEESRSALDELTQILGIGSVYEFQQV